MGSEAARSFRRPPSLYMIPYWIPEGGSLTRRGIIEASQVFAAHVDTNAHRALAGYSSEFVPLLTQRPPSRQPDPAHCHAPLREDQLGKPTSNVNNPSIQRSPQFKYWDVPGAGMAALRRGQEPMSLDVSDAQFSDLPFISALFLIRFDAKTGYAISWKRALPGIDLEGGVEYKSLPSGLHTVKEDLIYFVHGKHAGLSAFISAEASEESRNARMIAVGVLVPLSYGRLGRSWMHAENLKHLAEKLAVETPDLTLLEEYWDSHKLQDGNGSAQFDSTLDSPSSLVFKPTPSRLMQHEGHTRTRSASDGAALIPPGQSLSLYHPAWSLTTLLDTFGPLIFPIYRSALLRKRILVSCHAPVQQTCDFVYDLSVLSNIPLAVSNLISTRAPSQRLRPLFSIGVHDIPLLEEDLLASTHPEAVDDDDSDEEDLGQGWIACTTDVILSTKAKLYDVLVTMPLEHSQDAVEKVWPDVKVPSGNGVKATQRDLRRYRSLLWGLSRAKVEPQHPSPERNDSGGRLRRSDTSTTLVESLVPESSPSNLPDTDSIVEPVSWSALAYTGFIWWASAGERSIALDDETELDSSLLDGLSLEPQAPRTSKGRTFSGASTISHNAESSAKKELAIIAYFHRLTALILNTLSDIVDAADSDDDDIAPLRLGANTDEPEAPPIRITRADMKRMGLDEWSADDRSFAEDMMKAYFDRSAKVESHGVDICGVKIC
ncbi:hypothetical protein V495_07109 [Pseudogymnoascus sp. VKM F-4514 (FW-929)]|nr:hypothetical protein V495_07109 [Pseudogymnoascus sp. VKM F-4514 (FW-929)]KFY62406.1 hypothetical protein V497_02398 [Pseudogymnoascus sp. VKM F-4516 (FW-969)]